MIAVIDYHGGNSPSVINALTQIGLTAKLVAKESELKAADLIILPGVGSARATRTSLAALGLEDALLHAIREEKKYFLGICVGYQLLFTHSKEEETSCWDTVSGTVCSFDPERVRVPQIGWNHLRADENHPFMKGILPEHCYVYYVNSYYGNPQDESIVVGRSDYGGMFASLLQQDNISAAQFHLEKSGAVGLKMLENIVRYYLP